MLKAPDVDSLDVLASGLRGSCNKRRSMSHSNWILSRIRDEKGSRNEGVVFFANLQCSREIWEEHVSLKVHGGSEISGQ